MPRNDWNQTWTGLVTSSMRAGSKDGKSHPCRPTKRRRVALEVLEGFDLEAGDNRLLVLRRG